MALSISNAFITLFTSEVHHAFQGARSLAGLVREKTGVIGSTVKFPRLGTGQATIRVPQSDIVPVNLSYSQRTATMTDYVAGEYSDIFHQPKVNWNDRNELASSLANAMGRRIDQVLIDALVASSSTGTVANTISEDGTSGSASGLNTGKIREAKKFLDQNNVPPSDRCLLIHANSLSALLSQTAVQSADFNTIRALVDGSVNTWLGFNIITIGDRDEGGLAIDGSSDRLVYAFHKEALGMGIGMNQSAKIDYVPEKTSFLVANMFSGGATAIQDNGIVKITTRE